MKHNLYQYTLVSLFIPGVLSGSALAATTWMEARNDAMGGTGVASSHYGAAALANPALMTRFAQSDDVSLILPSVGLQASDPDRLQDGVDGVKDAWDRYDDELSSGSVSPGTAADLKRQLEKFKNAHANVQAGAGIVATVPNSVVPFALLVKSWGTASVDGRVSDQDMAYLDGVADGSIIPADDALTSRAYGRAAVVTDVGIALAREFETNGVRWSAGVTPKYQRIDLFNYNVTVQDYDRDDFRSSDYRNRVSGFNADAGAAVDLTARWRLGLAVQNIVPRSTETRSINGLKETFKIRPQATIGTSWHSDRITVALDVDLTPASGFTSDKKHQFAGIGAEFNAWNHAQLRAGYRQNIASSEGSAFSAGIGLSPFDVVHLDLTGLVGADRTYGAVVQMSVTF